MTRLTNQLTITNKLGLHARAATKLAQLSMKFEAKITIELDGKQADADSIMALMLLAGGQGKTVKVIAVEKLKNRRKNLSKIKTSYDFNIIHFVKQSPHTILLCYFFLLFLNDKFILDYTGYYIRYPYFV